MDKIEVGLHDHFASMASSQAQPARAPGSGTSTASSSAPSAADVLEVPFATVNSVAPGSPAEVAGLQIGDGIRRFGHVNWLNHEKLSRVAETVQRNEQVSDRRRASSLG